MPLTCTCVTVCILLHVLLARCRTDVILWFWQIATEQIAIALAFPLSSPQPLPIALTRASLAAQSEPLAQQRTPRAEPLSLALSFAKQWPSTRFVFAPLPALVIACSFFLQAVAIDAMDATRRSRRKCWAYSVWRLRRIATSWRRCLANTANSTPSKCDSRADICCL